MRIGIGALGAGAGAIGFAGAGLFLQTVNSFLSDATMSGAALDKFRGIRQNKFCLHLKECEWRFNHRSDDLYKILLSEFRKNPL